MIVDRTFRKGSSTPSTLGIIARGTAVALVLSIVIVVVSQLLGYPHPGLAATMAVIAASSFTAGQKRRPGPKSRMG